VDECFYIIYLQCVKHFGGLGLGTRKNRFGAHLHSDLDPGYYFLFQTSSTLLLFARYQQYNANDFGDELDFNIVYKFNITN